MESYDIKLLQHHITGLMYRDILLPKFRATYNTCMLSVENNCLRKLSTATKIEEGRPKHHKGYFSTYCISKCKVQGKIESYSHRDRLQAVANISGTRM